MLKYIEKQTCTSTQRRKSIDFGLTPASSVELEENEFGLDVSEAYAAQRVFFCPQGRGLYQIFFNPKSTIHGQSTIKNLTKACVICFFNF
jgi:hypothetical protein